jgi:WD40 repeat protein
MATNRQRRSRGVQLTATGYDRFYTAKQALENTENNGERFTLEELNELTGLSLGTLTRILNRAGVVDKRTLTIAFRAFGLDLTPQDYTKPQPSPPIPTRREAAAASTSPHPLTSPSSDLSTPYPLSPPSSLHADWGTAIDVFNFQHRQEELHTLQTWIQNDNCRLVALLGLGGMGKTYLAVKASQQLQAHFDRVIWRSLRQAPAFESLLEDMVGFLSGQPAPHADLKQLVKALQAQRCLIILDNLEALLRADRQAGAWLPGYEGYGELLRLLGQAQHQSCALFTSRETPAEVAAMVGHPAVQALTLRGCSDVSLAILQSRGLVGTTSQLHQLCQRYDGVPLAVTMIATLIQDLFNGDVGQFLTQRTWIVSDLRALLDSQWNRLNEVEQAIAYWLAINRESTSITDLEQDLVPSVPRHQLIENLESLRRRSLVEAQRGAFTLQAVVLDYLSHRLVNNAFAALTQAFEDANSDPTCLHTHALLKAQAAEQVQFVQHSQLIQPLLERLKEAFPTTQLIPRLRNLMTVPGADNTYWAGNLLNLLICLGADLSDQSFAELTLWQVDFRGINLVRTSFRGADLSDCRFSTTFGPVYALAFSPWCDASTEGESLTLVTGHGDGELRQWGLSGRLQQQVQHATAIGALTCHQPSPQAGEAMLAVGTFDGTIYTYDSTIDLQLIGSHQLHGDWVSGLVFLPEADQALEIDYAIASGSSDGSLKIWHGLTGAVQHSVELGPITALGVSQEGWVVCGDETGTLLLWQVESHREPWQFQHSHPLNSVAISADGNLVASIDTQQLQLWQRQGGALQPLWQTPLTSPWKSGFCPDNQTLAVTDGCEIQLFDAATSCPLHTLTGHTSQVWSLAFDPTGTLLASGSDDQIILWQVSTGQVWRTWKTAAIADSPVLAAIISGDGRLLVSGDGAGDVRLWDCRTHQCLEVRTGHRGAVRSLAIAPNNRLIASGSDSGLVRLWNLDTRLDRVILNHAQGITALAFSEPDGDLNDGDSQWLASGSRDGTLQLWDVGQGCLSGSLSGHEGRVLSIAFGPADVDAAQDNCQWLATGSSDYAIRLWRMGQATPQMVLRGHQGWVWSVAFSPDGRWLASGGDDRTIKLWDLTQQTCVRTLVGHQKLVWSVRFWPDAPGKCLRLVSGSLDQTIKVWSLEDNEPLDTLQATTDLLWAIQPMSTKLMVAGTKGNTVQLWDMAQKKQGINLTPQPLYADMDITQVRGLAPAAVKNLEALGAIQQQG